MEYYGYIYLTKNKLTGKIYIGKKNYVFRRKKKLTKKELAGWTGRGRKPKFKYVETESDWREYYGSSQELLQDIEKYGKENFSVRVLKKCKDKINLTYYEQFYQMKYGVLFNDTYNGNIAGKFYRGKIHK